MYVKSSRKHTIHAALPVFVLALILSGCGGGGGSGSHMDEIDGMTGGTDPGAGGGGPVVPTLAEVYSSDTAPDQQLGVVHVGLLRDYASDITISDDLTTLDDMPVSVAAIRRNAGGGYDITYRLEKGNSLPVPVDPAEVGNETTITFLPEHCDEVEEWCHIPADEDGLSFDFWTWGTPIPGGGQLDLTTDWTYFSSKHTSVADDAPQPLSQRNLFVFGLATPMASIPLGEATYNGEISSHAYRMNTAQSINDNRQRFWGTMRIVANFDMSTLDGEIYNVRNTQPGEPSSRRESRPTSSFSITNGQITDNQFTATLTGLDSDPNVPFNESARGFMGHIVGMFFGPNAEELGGVVAASRDVPGTDNDLNLYGAFGASQFGPAKTLGSEGLLAGLQRNFTASTSSLREDDGMATVERTGTGWSVTVDGRTVDFLESDYDHTEESYVRDTADGQAYLWTLTRGFGKTAEFNHFDVKGWAFGGLDSSDEEVWTRDYIAHGDHTPDSAMPTGGTATYAGRLEGAEFPSDDAIGSGSRTRYLGDMTLTADFAADGVAGEFSNLNIRVGGGSYSSSAGGANFNATINGNLFTATDLNGTGALAGYQNGNVRGAFFGPAAEEAAGVFDANDQTGNKLLTGYFGTTKNDE